MGLDDYVDSLPAGWIMSQLNQPDEPGRPWRVYLRHAGELKVSFGCGKTWADALDMAINGIDYAKSDPYAPNRPQSTTEPSYNLSDILARMLPATEPIKRRI